VDVEPFIPMPRSKVASVIMAYVVSGLLVALPLSLLVMLPFLLGKHLHVVTSWLLACAVLASCILASNIIAFGLNVYRARRQHVTFRTMFEAMAVYHLYERSRTKAQFEELGPDGLRQLIQENRGTLGDISPFGAVHFRKSRAFRFYRLSGPTTTNYAHHRRGRA
jgi:hypothetical protein